MDFAAKLSAQVSSMQAAFGAYAPTVKHHSLVLNRQQQRIDELVDANNKKDVTIGELEESRVRMAEEHERAISRMADTIEEHERRIIEMQQIIGIRN